MGAVQKLATVVIIGLVALATVLTVYIANEPGRRGSELTEQEEVAIVRGTDLYIQYCLQCHGPTGLGAAGGDGRVGGVVNSEFYSSDDPAQQQLAEEWARYRLQYGVPAEPISTDEIRMPAFGTELNVEEINELVFMLMNVDWNYVYNTAVHDTGETVAEAECAATPAADLPEYCGNLEDAPPLYPTAPPIASPVEEEDSGSGDTAQGEVAVTLEAQDPYAWSESEITLAPGEAIEVTNAGALQHDFTVEDLGISEALPNGQAVVITIPQDAEPGEYQFICSVPGHEAGGMVGTLTIEG